MINFLSKEIQIKFYKFHQGFKIKAQRKFFKFLTRIAVFKNMIKQIRSASTSNLLALQASISQELIRRQQRISSIDERLKIHDLPLRAVTRSTFLLDVKRHIEVPSSFDQNITIQNLLFQLPSTYWSNFSKTYPKYYSELKDALLKSKIDLKKIAE